MDIKDLNKPQLILLAILLSFVTSIATGITTVTLIDQAPSSVTIPINRVVKQTVEKIVPVPGKETVQTIVIKEEDLVVDAIEKNKSSVFSVSRDILNEEGKIVSVGAGKAFAISEKGILVADGSLLGEKSVFYVENSSGKFNGEFISLDKNGFAFLRVGLPLDEKNKISFTVPLFESLDKMKMGQKILIFGNSIASFIYDGNKDIRPGVSKSNGGAMVLNLNGEVLGIALSGEPSFASSDSIKDALNKFLEL